MHCTYCGQQLPPDAVTCYRCGRESPFQLLPINNEPGFYGRVEICEIGWVRKTKRLTTYIHFQAEMKGPGKPTVIATSEPAPAIYMAYWPDNANPQWGPQRIPRDTPDALKVFTELINGLRSEGWSPRDRGRLWWNQRFQRLVEPLTDAPEASATRRLPDR